MTADELSPENVTFTNRPNRRTVMAGMAWATPAVLVATNAPFAAASPDLCVIPGTSSLSFQQVSSGPQIHSLRLWATAGQVQVPLGDPRPTSITFTFWSSRDNLTWSNNSGSAWSVPIQQGAPRTFTTPWVGTPHTLYPYVSTLNLAGVGDTIPGFDFMANGITPGDFVLTATSGMERPGCPGQIEGSSSIWVEQTFS